ncbi:MAG: JAB domain-containing protein, partial [Acutalibacteraceae bacterium]
SMVDINNRRIVEAALRHNASCVVLGHNHPNGVAVPSRTDVETTCMLARLLRSMDIWLYDHIIVADGEYFSMARCNKFEAIFS